MIAPNFARHLVSGRLEEIRQKGQPPKAVVQVRLATNPLKDWSSYDITLRGLLAQNFNQAAFSLGDKVTMLLSDLKVPAKPDLLDCRPRAFVAKGLDFYDPLSETDPPIDHLTHPKEDDLSASLPLSPPKEPHVELTPNLMTNPPWKGATFPIPHPVPEGQGIDPTRDFDEDEPALTDPDFDPDYIPLDDPDFELDKDRLLKPADDSDDDFEDELDDELDYDSEDAEDYDSEDAEEYDSEDNEEYDSEDNEEYDSEDNEEYDSEGDEEYDSEDNEDYDSEDNEEYDSEDNEEYDSEGNEEDESEGNEEYESEGDEEYESEDNEEYDSEDNEEYDSEDNEEYDSEDNEEYESEDNEEYESEDDEDCESEDNEEYDSEDNEDYDSEDNEEYESEDDEDDDSESPEYARNFGATAAAGEEPDDGPENDPNIQPDADPDEVPDDGDDFDPDFDPHDPSDFGLDVDFETFSIEDDLEWRFEYDPETEYIIYPEVWFDDDPKDSSGPRPNGNRRKPLSPKAPSPANQSEPIDRASASAPSRGKWSRRCNRQPKRDFSRSGIVRIKRRANANWAQNPKRLWSLSSPPTNSDNGPLEPEQSPAKKRAKEKSRVLTLKSDELLAYLLAKKLFGLKPH